MHSGYDMYITYVEGSFWHKWEKSKKQVVTKILQTITIKFPWNAIRICNFQHFLLFNCPDSSVRLIPRMFQLATIHPRFMSPGNTQINYVHKLSFITINNVSNLTTSTKTIPGPGVCLFAYGRKLGELCRRDADCEAGLVCDNVGTNGNMICRAPMAIAKQYAEECSTSNECDITR